MEQFQNARTGLEVATRQLESARFIKMYSEIRALSNGMVMRKLASEGQVISPGTSVFQTNGSGVRKWILRCAISDREWATLQTGDAATITADVLPDKTWTGTVTKKSAAVEASLGALNIEITLNESADLASGIFGKATLRASQKQKAWKIPYEGLLDGNAQQGYVFINQNNKAHKAPVTVGEINKDYVLKSGFILRPIVDEYVSLLRNWILAIGYTLPVPSNSFKLLSCDVDMPYYWRSKPLWKSLGGRWLQHRKLGKSIRDYKSYQAVSR